MKLLEAQSIVDRRLAVVLADLAEELFHLPRRLIDVDELARPPAHAPPDMGDFARDENTLAGAQVKLLLADVEFKLAIDDVDPLILIVVEMLRSPGVAVEFENTHRAVGVLRRDLAIDRLPFGAAELDVLAESVIPRGDAEAHEHFFA